MSNILRYKGHFIKTLQNLLLDFEAQTKMYPKYVYPIEAILTDIYPDCLIYVPQLYEEGCLSSDVLESIKRFEVEYYKVIDEIDWENYDLFFTSQHVVEMKRIAKEILVLINTPSDTSK